MSYQLKVIEELLVEANKALIKEKKSYKEYFKESEKEAGFSLKQIQLKRFADTDSGYTSGLLEAISIVRGIKEE